MVGMKRINEDENERKMKVTVWKWMNFSLKPDFF